MLSAELDPWVVRSVFDTGVVGLRWVLLSANCGRMVLILDQWHRGLCGHLLGRLSFALLVGLGLVFLVCLFGLSVLTAGG